MQLECHLTAKLFLNLKVEFGVSEDAATVQDSPVLSLQSAHHSHPLLLDHGPPQTVPKNPPPNSCE